MAWPKGKPRKRIEASTDSGGVDDVFIRGNRRAIDDSAARRKPVNEKLNRWLAEIREQWGPDAAARAAPAIRQTLMACAEKGLMPGQKPKPMRPLPEHIYKAQQAAKAAPLRTQTGALS